MKSIIKLGKHYTNKWKQINIVFKFNCKNCPATYIGECKRALRVRINEHKNDENSESIVCGHQLEFNHKFDCESTKIVDYVPGYWERSTSEMINIKFNKFSINKKDIFALNRIYLSVHDTMSFY